MAVYATCRSFACRGQLVYTGNPFGPFHCETCGRDWYPCLVCNCLTEDAHFDDDDGEPDGICMDCYNERIGT